MIIIYFTSGGGSKPRPPPPKPFVYGGVYYDPSGNTSNPLLPPIPKEWVLAPLNSTFNRNCSPVKATLLSFGITNAIIAAIVLVIGCRPIVNKLTLGVFGGGRSKAPYWSWVFTVALQIVANLLIAITITHTDGYRHLSMLNVLALYSARPRISIIWLGILRIMVRVRPRRPAGARSLREKFWSFFNIKETEHVYWSSFVPNAIAEVCMQIFSAVFIGVTWHRFPNPEIKAHMKSSMNAMFTAPALTALAIIGPIVGRKEAFSKKNQGRIRGRLVCLLILFLPLVSVGYAGSWVFFSNFLYLPDNM
ncbi:MAG: hypothetical protein M1839_009131 [Geoglossum umbratile]|nr:MAG: hypothetical protein M1839_009131 [Geoglossum umbratile]